jgi:hypothetical protein
MTREASLRSIKVLHTVIWLIFALCIVAIPIFGSFGHYGTAGWLVGIVLLEVLVLVFNGLRCPLTAVAARYTDDRRANFDIYLPIWLARKNQAIFGTLFALGALLTFTQWAGSTHAVSIWLSFVVLAVVNGRVRERLITPRLGEQTGHVISTIILSSLILVVTSLTLPWLGTASVGEAWQLGALWLTLTMAFEFLAGHYLFHTPWAELCAAYNVARGRIWVLVLLVTFLAPILALELRRQPMTRA